MNILTIEYVCLVAATLIVLNAVSSNDSKKKILLCGSMLFYAWWDIRFLFFMLFYALFVYYQAIFISKFSGKKSTISVSIGITVSVGILAYFKYFYFIVKEIPGSPQLALRAENIIAPIGISFVILSAIGYLLDVYWKKYAPKRDIIEIMLFLFYFPKLLSGPIERENIFCRKINSIAALTKERLWYGIQVILFGLIKKMVIADRLGVCVDAVFRAPEMYSGLSILWAMVSYTIQIYCDFSGYTDIARGVSYLLGVSLEKNFDLPYCAGNPSEFWRRWHISLSAWFRDYVYIPLGGSHCSSLKTYRNIMITMLISGIWHGANWTYWIWGLLHGAAQCMHRMWKKRKMNAERNKRNVPVRAVAYLSNLIFICLTWTIFRAESLGDFLLICRKVIDFSPGIDYFYVWTIPYMLLLIAALLYGCQKNKGHGCYPVIERRDFIGQTAVWIVIFLIIGLAYMGDMAFIYNSF